MKTQPKAPKMRRIKMAEMWDALSNTVRADWAIGFHHRYVGRRVLDDYGGLHHWDVWSFHSKRTRELE